ncbi:MAG: ABC transporter permease subunit [Clostridia bacterium]|nr:ABC transporter permease subunit [Clostridia bacterium]
MKKILKKWQNVLYPLLSLGIIVGLWALLAKIVNIELIIPSLQSTFRQLGRILSAKDFYIALGSTLWRSLASFAIGAFSALGLSLLSLLKPVKKILSPFIKIIRSVPTMSVILLAVIWLKPTVSPIFVAFLINFPIMYSGFLSAMESIDGELISMSKIYNVSLKDRVLSLYLPSVAPAAFDCMQSSISLTVKIIISAEVLAQTRNSLGIMMQISRAYLETAELIAYTITAIVLSYLLELVVFGIKKAVVRWK